MKLKAKIPHSFNGVHYNSGDTYEADERWARILLAIGKAEIAPAEDDKPKRTYKRRDMQAEGK